VSSAASTCTASSNGCCDSPLPLIGVTRLAVTSRACTACSCRSALAAAACACSVAVHVAVAAAGCVSLACCGTSVQTVVMLSFSAFARGCYHCDTSGTSAHYYIVLHCTASLCFDDMCTVSPLMADSCDDTLLHTTLP
jgi:hypothetical protein